jgi:hypothetical protein
VSFLTFEIFWFDLWRWTWKQGKRYPVHFWRPRSAAAAAAP